MEDADFSDEFCRFIQSAIPAVDAAELLLLLAEGPDAWWTQADALARLRPGISISDADAARYVELFQLQGLIAVGPDKRIQFHPASAALAAQVESLGQAYRERPVTLIRVIYALRDKKIQSFADAFKLRRK
jgi:hypothetical protein